jgi:hypothetical protein
MFAAAAVAGMQSARRREADRALRSVLAGPAPLWHRTDEDLEPLWLLHVYVQDVSLVSKLGNTRLQLRVRYGDSGCYQEKYSQKVRSSTPVGDEQAKASFEAMFVFPWSQTLAPSIMLDVVKLGFIDWTISTAAIRIPFGEGQPGALEHDVLLFGKKGEDGFIGQLSLLLEVRSISRAELEFGLDVLTMPSLARADIVTMGRAGPMHPVTMMGNPVGPAIGGTPVVLGQVMPGGAPSGGHNVVQGSTVHSADVHSVPVGLPRPSRGAGAREEVYQEPGGRVRHVLITRHPDGSEERLEWSD